MNKDTKIVVEKLVKEGVSVEKVIAAVVAPNIDDEGLRGYLLEVCEHLSKLTTALKGRLIYLSYGSRLSKDYHYEMVAREGKMRDYLAKVMADTYPPKLGEIALYELEEPKEGVIHIPDFDFQKEVDIKEFLS